MNQFLPVNQKELQERGISQLDFIYVSGDAYVDHPSFGHAIITRVLESRGYTVGIIAQPDYTSCEDFKRLGRPRLGFFVSSGNLDSMVCHYTAAKKKRSTDSYSPGGKAGKRPDRAVIVYCNRIREAYKDIPIIIGGIEASLRRFAHYDYWDNRVRRSILADSKADLLSYGMGERSIIEIADRLNAGVPVRKIRDIRGTCYFTKEIDCEDYIELPSFETVREEKNEYAKATKIQYEQQDAIRGKTLVQQHIDRYLIANPPQAPLTRRELDEVYALPYMRAWHPSYDKEGGVPAIAEVQFSITSNRGCFGNCNFCALAFHQGRIVTSRSHESILAEAEQMVHEEGFKGYIHDVGGPTANFRNPACKQQLKTGVCAGKRCLFPRPCKNMEISHKDYLTLLRKIRAIPGIKKVFIRSGIRFDYLMADRDDTFFRELCQHHISGQLKVAPEHISNSVLSKMGKPSFEIYEKFYHKFTQINQKLGKKQYLVPYFMSSHPGSTLHDAIQLAQYFRRMHYMPEQVQDFYPTPGTISTCMFYTGLDPFTMEPVYVPKTYEEKQMQRALLQFNRPENRRLVEKALKLAGREDLIGYDKDCLIRPSRPKNGQKGVEQLKKGKQFKQHTKKKQEIGIHSKRGNNRRKKK